MAKEFLCPQEIFCSFAIIFLLLDAKWWVYKFAFVFKWATTSPNIWDKTKGKYLTPFQPALVIRQFVNTMMMLSYCGFGQESPGLGIWVVFAWLMFSSVRLMSLGAVCWRSQMFLWSPFPPAVWQILQTLQLSLQNI